MLKKPETILAEGEGGHFPSRAGHSPDFIIMMTNNIHGHEHDEDDNHDDDDLWRYLLLDNQDSLGH